MSQIQKVFTWRSEPVWRSVQCVPRGRIPADIREWLVDPASLTRRIQTACKGQFRVSRVSEGLERPMVNEARTLNMPGSTFGFVRQVRLLCNELPWVFARTVIPAATLEGRRRRLMHLGNRPLGAYLFADPKVKRGAVEITQIDSGRRLYADATAGLPSVPHTIWGRRSVFWLDGRPLLVSEFFLPGILQHHP